MIQREHVSILASVERMILRRMAASVPRWVTPDMLTGFGILGAAVCLLGYVLSANNVEWLWVANLGLLMHWMGDSLDGTLARVRKIERPNYGFYLDQTIDVVGNLLIAIGVGLSPFIRMESALLMLAAYHMLSIQTLVRSVVVGRFRVDVIGLGPTEFRLAIVAMNLGIMIFGAPQFHILGQTITWCDALIGIGCIGMLVVFLFLARKDAQAQLSRDRKSIEQPQQAL